MLEHSFHLQKHLDELQARDFTRLALRGESQAAFAAWKAELSAELAHCLGLSLRPVEKTIPAVHLSSQQLEGYRKEKFALDAGEGVQIPVYLLTPDGRAPSHTLLVFHGHEPGAGYCMGEYPDQETEKINLARDNDYARRLVRAGYRVAVVEQRGLGERLSDQVNTSAGYPKSCRHLAMAYLQHGRTLLGERCKDGMTVITWLFSLPGVDRRHLGCTGHSGGGATALWLAALDERIGAVLVSGYFSSFAASIMAMEHCECNTVPGISGLAEMGDIAALLAPRLFCALNGRNDPLFPLAGASQQIETVRRAYQLMDAPEACTFHIHAGGHAYHHELSQAWFASWRDHTP